jgi:hypothetical protein
MRALPFLADSWKAGNRKVGQVVRKATIPSPGVSPEQSRTLAAPILVPPGGLYSARDFQTGQIVESPSWLNLEPKFAIPL